MCSSLAVPYENHICTWFLPPKIVLKYQHRIQGVRGGGRGHPHIHHNTSGQWKGWALKLMCIELPIYLFLKRCLDLIFTRANPLFRPLEGVAPEISTFLCPNGTRFACCHFRAQKVLISGPASSNCPHNGYYLHQNYYIWRHINNRYINSYFDLLLFSEQELLDEKDGGFTRLTSSCSGAEVLMESCLRVTCSQDR
jgi:hypothetical protein